MTAKALVGGLAIKGALSPRLRYPLMGVPIGSKTRVPPTLSARASTLSTSSTGK